MSVLIETTSGNIVVDLDYKAQELASFHFIQLCKSNYYFFAPFYSLQQDSFVTSGNPNYPGEHPIEASREEGSEFPTSIERLYQIPDKFRPLALAKTMHFKASAPGMISSPRDIGTIAFKTSVLDDAVVLGTEFIITLTDAQEKLGKMPQVVPFGKVVEGFNVLEIMNNSATDCEDRFLEDIRITHVHMIYDPFSNYKVNFKEATPSEIQLKHMRIPELTDPNYKSNTSVTPTSKINAITLELIGDIPHYNVKPSPETLFVAKLNPITTGDALRIVFARFGTVVDANIISDPKSGKSLSYGFIKFSTVKEAEKAYYTLSKGCVIDGRQVVIDFSQSSKSI